MLRKIIFLALLLLLVGGLVGYYQWNRKPETVDDKRAIAISATQLADEFASNEQAASKKYLDQALEVSGTVIEATKNQDGKTVVLLESSDPLSGVQCTFRDDALAIKTGDNMTAKGFCTGFTTVVLLSDCIPKR